MCDRYDLSVVARVENERYLLRSYSALLLNIIFFLLDLALDTGVPDIALESDKLEIIHEDLKVDFESDVVPFDLYCCILIDIAAIYVCVIYFIIQSLYIRR